MGLKLPGDEEVMQLENPGVSGSKKIGNEFPTAFAPGVSEESSTVNPAEFDALWNSSTNPDLNPGVVSDVNLQTSSIKYPQYSEGITKQRTTSTSRSRSKNVSQAAVGREIKREQIDEDMKDEDVVIVSTEKGNPDLHEMQEACDPMTVGDLHGQQDILESSSHHPVESQPYVLPGLGWGTDDAGPSVEKTVMNPPQWSVPSSHPTTSTEGHKSTYDPTSSIHDEVKTESDDVILVDPTGSAEGSLDHRPVVSNGDYVSEFELRARDLQKGRNSSFLTPTYSRGMVNKRTPKRDVQTFGRESSMIPGQLVNVPSTNAASTDVTFCNNSDGVLDLNRTDARGKMLNTCPVCLKTFSSKVVMERHRRIHSNVKLFKCSYCPKTFGYSFDKTKHERIHRNEKPYACCHCGKKFSDSSNRTKHEKRHSQSQ